MQNVVAKRITTGGTVGKPTASPSWKAAVAGARKASAWNATGVPEQGMRPKGSTGTWESQKPPCEKKPEEEGLPAKKRPGAEKEAARRSASRERRGTQKKGEEQGIEARRGRKKSKFHFSSRFTVESQRPQRGTQRGLALCGSLSDLRDSAVKFSLHLRSSSRAAA